MPGQLKKYAFLPENCPHCHGLNDRNTVQLLRSRKTANAVSVPSQWNKIKDFVLSRSANADAEKGDYISTKNK